MTLPPESLDIEAALCQFEWGESPLVCGRQPTSPDQLQALAWRFAQHYSDSSDLRFLNAVLKILDRTDFEAAYPQPHAPLARWAEEALARLERTADEN